MSRTASITPSVIDYLTAPLPEGSPPILNVRALFNEEASHNGHVCALCGRPLGKATKYVLCAGGGLTDYAPLALNAWLETNDGGFMGIHYLGTDCARKVERGIRALGLDPALYMATTPPDGDCDPEPWDMFAGRGW